MTIVNVATGRLEQAERDLVLISKLRSMKMYAFALEPIRSELARRKTNGGGGQ